MYRYMKSVGLLHKITKIPSFGMKLRFESTSVGFIGLGNMGSSMAVNLAKKGFKVQVFDKNPAAIEALRDSASVHSLQSVSNLNQLSVSTVITVLPESRHVLSLFDTGLSSVIKPGTLMIDCTTGDISDSKVLAEKCASVNASFVDAPISGGVMGARDATLTFMVGGSETDFQSAQPYLQAMGKKVFHCGPVGTGLAAKICNNMLLGISMLGTSEAMELGRRLGLEPTILASILNVSSGRCWSSEVYNPVPGVVPNIPSSKDYNGGFGTALMTKDLGLAQNASTAVKSPTPLGSITHQLYRVLSQTELSTKDFSVIYQFLKGK